MLASIAAVSFSGLALAQNSVGPSEGEWEITASGSGTNNNDFDGHVIGVTGSAGKYVTDTVLVGVRQSINFADVENGDDQTNFATRAFADYVFDLGRWRPFVGVNFGGIYGENVNETFAAGPEAGVKYYADDNTFGTFRVSINLPSREGAMPTTPPTTDSIFTALGSVLTFSPSVICKKSVEYL
jgi:hypothetical protein